jgi:hypothetical protein
MSQKKLRREHLRWGNKKVGTNKEKHDKMQQNRVLKILKSFINGVEELPKTSIFSLPAPTLSLFREDTRGLGGGVDVSIIYWGRQRIRGSAIFFGKDHGIGRARWSRASNRKFFLFFLLLATVNI